MRQGDRALEEQFERVLGEHGAAIARLAYTYETAAGVREELVQEIALAIWQALPHFRGECSERKTLGSNRKVACRVICFNDSHE